MKIGYPCINNSIGCTSNHTFRLKNYSKELLYSCIGENLKCLEKISKYNLENDILFFRLGSQLVPFASHPICKENWQKDFSADFRRIGNFIKKNKIRISMHPDQFVLLNSPKKEIVENSIKELIYHTEVLDLMKLPLSAKVQIHVGGVYGDKEKAIFRFIQEYKKLPKKIKRRLVIENDHRLFSIKDLFKIYKATGITILFDVFHHQCLNNGENVFEVLKQVKKTWGKIDGIPMVDYSNQEPNGRLGKHSQEIDINSFKNFLKEKGSIDLDIMLEIKDKEKSALKAVKILKYNEI